MLLRALRNASKPSKVPPAQMAGHSDYRLGAEKVLLKEFAFVLQLDDWLDVQKFPGHESQYVYSKP